MPKRVTTVLVAMLAAAGCTSHARPETSGTAAAADTKVAHITGVVWKDTNSGATVVYTAGAMRVFDGCSNQLAHLHVEHRALVQGSSIGSVSVCTGMSSTQQASFATFDAVVAGPASWSRSGNVLTLTAPGKGSLRLVTNGAPAPMLIRTTWRLAGYTGTDAYEHGAARHVGLVVRPNGSFAAGLACGDVTGSADVSPDRIRFVKVSLSTCAAWHSAADEVELEVLTARAATYAIRGTQLMIYGARGRFLVYKTTNDVLVTGRLTIDGLNPRPLPGQVTARGPRTTQTVHVGADGRYQLLLLPGTYAITGTSPRYDNGHGICRTTPSRTTPTPITLTEGHNANVDLGCIER